MHGIKIAVVTTLDVSDAENAAPFTFGGQELCPNPPSGGDFFPRRLSHISTPRRANCFTLKALMKIVRVLNLEHAEEESIRVRTELEKGFDIEWRRAADLEEFRSCLRSGSSA